jgi:hypothetical protein
MNLLGIACFTLSAAVMGAVFYFTKLLLDARRGANKEVHRFADDLRKRAFRHITSFLAIFLYITFFLSFSLAFHDQALALQGKTGKDIKGHLVNGRKRRAVITNVPEFSMGETAAVDSEVRSTSKVVQIFFQDKEYTPSVDYGLISTPLSSLHNNVDLRRKARNAQTIETLAQELRRDTGYTRTEILVVGHATKTIRRKNSEEFASNRDISVDRAKEVERLIRDRLGAKALNVHADSWGAGVTGGFLDETLGCTGSEPEDTCVEIRVDRILGDLSQLQYQSLVNVHELKLLDYVYFMIYTITTTGYGDIQPASSFAKLLCSVANLYELFFIVIFFNVTLSAANNQPTSYILYTGPNPKSHNELPGRPRDPLDPGN